MSFDFDARQYEPQQPYSPVPGGWYIAMITEDEIKPTKANDGTSMLVQKFTIVSGVDGNPQFKGRSVQNRLNLWNRSTQAVEIAQRQLSAQCHVTGQLVLPANQGGSKLLLNKPMQILVGMDETGKYNQIDGYKDMQGNDPGKQGQGQAARPAAPPVAPPAAQPFAPPQQAQQPAAQPAQQAWAPPGGQAPQMPAQQPVAQPTQFGPPGGGAPAFAPPGGAPAFPGAAPAPAQQFAPQQQPQPAGNWGPQPGAFPGAAPAPAAQPGPAPAAWQPQPGAAPGGGAPWQR